MIAAVTVAALIGLVLGAAATAIAVGAPAYQHQRRLAEQVASWRRRAKALGLVAQVSGVPHSTVDALLLADEDQAEDPDATRVLRADDPTQVIEVIR